ncbi:hypothetical protein [Actinophytocola sp.]|jgi:hypothetical protein|uniref:sunset domain-containing protein n=1 Tax=Actinophytocola sp. TaxID=1872138 RepID=UPI002ED79FBA
MPIFGQVWLWSSLAFLLGALLCWALVALPARRRVGELESELAARARRQPERYEPRRRQLDDEELEVRRALARATRDDDAAEPLTRAYALPDTPAERSAGRMRSVPEPAGMRSDLIGGGLVAPPETDTDTELADGPHAAATQYLNVGSGSLGSALEAPPEVPAEQDNRGWFDNPAEGGDAEGATPAPGEIDGRLVDDDGDDPDDDGGTVFTQRTRPIPGEVIRQIDEAGKAEAAHALADEPADALVDDLADEPEHRAPGHRGLEHRRPGRRSFGDRSFEDREPAHQQAEQTVEAEPVDAPSQHDDPFAAAEVTSLLTPEPEPTGTAPAHGGHGQTEVMPAQTTEAQTEVVSTRGRRSAAGDHSRRGAEDPEIMPGVTVHAKPAKSPLPKRVPSKPQRRTPFGVQTTSPAESVADAGGTAGETAAASAEPTRSLFEPIVPAGDAPAVPPPPHRMREGNGHGPFGPGSAMPLPGGASPSPEYTIKASVSALRYCTPESPQFGRTVAEVWFKSPADAERVGFRPVG